MTVHELQVHVLLISTMSTRGWDVFSMRHESSLGEVDAFFNHEKLSAKKGAKFFTSLIHFITKTRTSFITLTILNIMQILITVHYTALTY